MKLPESLPPEVEAMARDVAEGLTASPKRVPPRYFYDDRGSRLFHEITRQPEYYLTDCEREIFEAHGDALVAGVPRGAALVELGSGSAEKTRVLIEAMLRRQDRLEYRPIDISPGALEDARGHLEPDYPRLVLRPVAATYREGLRRVGGEDAAAKLVLFIGSSVGNLEPPEATAFLRDVADTLDAADRLLLGTDLRKDPAVLHAAYNDAAGVTAAFNKNLLRRLNRELGADFPVDAFRHRAHWNPDAGRVEMHLESLRDQEVTLGALGLTVAFDAGETVHTENSYKYTTARVDDLAAGAGLRREATWTDAREWFAVHRLAPRR